jgi:hypothetical protein
MNNTQKSIRRECRFAHSALLEWPTAHIKKEKTINNNTKTFYNFILKKVFKRNIIK